MTGELKPSILLIGNFLSKHAGSRSAGEELNVHLEQRGWSTITTSRILFRIPRLLDMIAHVLFYLSSYQIAYIEVYSGPAFLWAEIAVTLLHFLRKPCILALHGGRLPEFAGRNMKRIKRLLDKATRIVTPSHFILTSFEKIYPDICYIPNGIDLEKYLFRQRKQPAPNLIWIRAFHSIYQPEKAVRILARVREVFPNAQLTMIGPDKNDGSLQRTLQDAQTANVMDGLSIIGAVPKSDIPKWLDRGDIFLNTPLYESFGVAVLEAACAGLLIVSTDVGELPYLWENERNAILVSSNNINGMGDAVIRILTEPSLADSLSINARQGAERFDWSVILPQWEKVFFDAYGSA